MDQCQSCKMYLQEEPRIPCFCGETKRNIGIIVNEACVFSDSGNLIISSFLSKRNFNNTSLLNKITNLNLNSFLENKEIKSCNNEGIIYFHDEFINGTQNGDIKLARLIDFKNISGDNLIIFNNFIKDVYNHNLSGKNKPSHNDNSRHELYPDYWHYHCGPYLNKNKNIITDLFSQNLNGDTSSPIIHYIKQPNKIIIVAFATEHTQKFKDKSKTEETISF